MTTASDVTRLNCSAKCALRNTSLHTLGRYAPPSGPRVRRHSSPRLIWSARSKSVVLEGEPAQAGPPVVTPHPESSPMLDSELKLQLKTYLTYLRRPIEITAFLDEQPKSVEIWDLVRDIAEASDKITVRRAEVTDGERVPS